MRPPAVSGGVSAVSGGAASSPSAAGEHAPGAEAQQLGPAELKIMAEETRHTVLAIAYDDTPENVVAATEAYATLREEGLEAVIPYRIQDRVFVFVGGAGSIGELEDVLRKVRAVRHDGAAMFRGASTVNTADYFDR